MDNNEGTSEDGQSIFGLGPTNLEELPSSLLNSAGALITFRGRSRVWSEFFITQDGKKVTCRRCGDSLAYSNSHSTSSMLKHLKRKHHMDLYPSLEEERTAKSPRTTPEKPKKGTKVKRVAVASNVPDEQCIQHDPLEFDEPCIRMRWTDHSDTFLRNFSCVYNDEAYTDATIVAEKQFFKAHRLILSSASEFFDETFKLMGSGQHPVIFLKDTKALELRMLLDFIYRGEVSIPAKLIPNLVKLGGDMRVRGLCDFVWNESVISNAFQGYTNDLRASGPSSTEIPSELSPVTSQPTSFGSSPAMTTRSLETFLRQQPNFPPNLINSTTGEPVKSSSSLSDTAAPRTFSAGTKRIRLITATTNNANFRSNSSSQDLNQQGEEQQQQMGGGGQRLLVITSTGETILSNSQVDLAAQPNCVQDQPGNTRTGENLVQRQNLAQGMSESHCQLHSTSQSTPSEVISEVVYSISNAEVSERRSADEILMSDTGDGRHTIVVYADSEDENYSSTNVSDQKPF